MWQLALALHSNTPAEELCKESELPSNGRRDDLMLNQAKHFLNILNTEIIPGNILSNEDSEIIPGNANSTARGC